MNLITMLIEQCNNITNVYTIENAQLLDEFSLSYSNTTKQILYDLEKKLSVGARADLDLLIDVTSRLRKAAVKLYEKQQIVHDEKILKNEFPSEKPSSDHLQKMATKLSKQAIELETMARVVKRSNDYVNKKNQAIMSENSHRMQRGEGRIHPIMSESRANSLEPSFSPNVIDNDIFRVGIEVSKNTVGFYTPASEGRYVGDRIILNPQTFLSKQDIVNGKARPAATQTHETFHRFQDLLVGSGRKNSFHLTDAQMFQNPALADGNITLPEGMPKWWLDEVIKPVLKERPNVIKNYKAMMNKIGVFNITTSNAKGEAVPTPFADYLTHPDEILAREYANYVATLDIKVVNEKTTITGGNTKYAGSKIAFENLRRRGVLTDFDLLMSVGLEQISDDEYAKMLIELGSVDKNNGTFVFKPHYAGAELSGDILPDRDIGVYSKIMTFQKGKKQSKAQIQREIDAMYETYEQSLRIDMALADTVSDFSSKELGNLVKEIPKAAKKAKKVAQAPRETQDQLAKRLLAEVNPTTQTGGATGGGGLPPTITTLLEALLPDPANKPVNMRATGNSVNLGGKKGTIPPRATGWQTLEQLNKTIPAGAYGGLVEGIGPDIISKLNPKTKAFKTQLDQTLPGLEGLFTVINARLADANGALKQTTVAVSNTTGIDYNKEEIDKAASLQKETNRQERLNQRATEQENARIDRARVTGQEIVRNKDIFLNDPSNANIIKELERKNPDLLNNPNVQITGTRFSESGAERIIAREFNDINSPNKQVVREAKVLRNDNGAVWTQQAKGVQTFTQQLGHNIKELAMWSIGMGLIYGPMTKLNELVQTAITNQALLAKVTITLGESQSATGKIFSNAAKIARETGVSIDGIIAGYNTAFRATGDITDKTERYAVANQLLTDSIILSRLSTLDQATATDTLVAALSQLNMPLDQGQVLLDKWVKVSRVANVDVTTLATSFAIVGEAAMNAGLSIDELNGLVAVIASTGVTNAKETGNAARAIISGATNETTSKKLGMYGIATSDAGGKSRDFMQIVGDINKKYGAGLISDDQLNEIALIIAQGNRRQAQTVVTLARLADIRNIASQSGSAKGESQKALAIEMQTVQTATVGLNNAFVELAQALGGEGGVLAASTSVLNTFSTLVEIIAKLTTTVGTATPAITAMGAALLLTKSGSSIGEILGVPKFSRNVIGKPSGSGKTFAESMMEDWMTPSKRGKVLGIGAAAVAGGLQVSKGDPFGGAAIMASGALASAVNPVLGLITTAIVAGFMEGARKAKESLGDYGYTKPDVVVDEKGNVVDPGLTKTQKQSRALGGNDSQFGEFLGGILLGSLNMGASIAGFFGDSEGKQYTDTASGAAGTRMILERFGMPKDELDALFAADTQAQQDKVAAAKQKIVLEKAMVVDTTFAETGRKQISTYIQENAFGANPTLTVTEARKLSERVPAFASFAATALEPFKGDYSAITTGGKTGAYSYMADLAQTATDDQMTTIGELVKEMTDLQELIDAAKKEGIKGIREGEADVSGIKAEGRGIAEAQTYLTGLQKNYIPAVQQIYNQGIMQNATIPGMVDMQNVGMDKAQVMMDSINKYLESVWEVMDKGEVMFEKDRRKTAESIVKFSDGMKKLPILGEDLSAAIEAGFLPKSYTTSPGFQQYDATSSQLQAGIAKGLILQKRAEDMGYKPIFEQTIAQTKKDDVITVINPDGIPDELKIALEFLQMGLADILEVENKQLEGIYNLPAGMSIWVPTAAKYMEPKGTGGTTGGSTEPLLSAPGLTAAAAGLGAGTGLSSWSLLAAGAGLGAATPGQYRTRADIRTRQDANAALYANQNKPSAYEAYWTNPRTDPLPGSDPRDRRSYFYDAGGGAGLTVPPVNTKLTVQSTTNVTLLIDSRVLANIIKKTQADDMVRFATSSPTAQVNLIGAT
jgi:TP901 family phage tail tape measure protein